MEWSRLHEMVREKMSGRRFMHTQGVIELAEKLARHYDLDPDQVRLASLLHDYARGWPDWELLKKAEDFAIVVTEVDRAQPDLLHGPVSAELARHEFGIVDPIVLEAIHWHTTGHEHMGEIGKVVYIADSLEKGRDYPGVEQLRQMMYAGLDQIYLDVMNHTISYLIDSGKLIHPASIHARNQLLLARTIFKLE